MPERSLTLGTSGLALKASVNSRVVVSYFDKVRLNYDSAVFKRVVIMAPVAQS